MASRSGQDAARQAGFVFRGTVQKLKKANMAGVPVDHRTAVVRVDEVIRAPEALSTYAGKDVTVQVGGRKKIKAGDEAVFYTNGWLFGEQIAVLSLDHEPSAKAMARLRPPTSDPVRNLMNHDLQERIQAADVICSGTVKVVRLAEEKPELGERIRPREHDPGWQEAVIDIDEIHKGQYPTHEIVLRFPNSRDMMWHKAPKFRTGQAGIFLCHREGPSAMRAGRARAARAHEVYYTALHPLDFHPSARAETIRALLSRPSKRRER